MNAHVVAIVSEKEYVDLVKANLDSGCVNEAEQVALTGVSKFPESVSLLSQLGLIAFQQKNWLECINRLQKLLDLKKDEFAERNYIRLIRAYVNFNDRVKAKTLAISAIEKFPISEKIRSELTLLGGMRKSADDESRCLSHDTFSHISRRDIKPIDLLLTTFPGHRSKNVGDHLISHSAIKLIAVRNSGFSPKIVFRAENLDAYEDGAVRNIIAPGFSVSNGVYPELFGLYSDLNRLPDFYPVGCSFQHVTPSFRTFEEHEYDGGTLEVLRFIASRSGPFPCRDQLIVKLLHRYDVPAVYSGDLAIYDEEKLNTQFVPPAAIKSVVFTIQHHDRYYAQSFKLLELIKERFPGSQLYVAFHSKAGPKPQKIANYAVSLGFSELHLYGDVTNLVVYDSMDLHIGYRLHGHISFLRRRKPSILLVEDARSFGLAHTSGTDVGCFEAISLATMEADMSTPDLAMNFVEEQIRCNFQDYQRVFRFIDKTYNEFVRPYFDDLAAKTL
jgi:tetratricopeptide (TPR) repeat protein